MLASKTFVLLVIYSHIILGRTEKSIKSLLNLSSVGSVVMPFRLGKKVVLLEMCVRRENVKT